MLFNSYTFIFGFFPVVFLGFFVIAKLSRESALGWLALASLFFYGWWSIKAVPLLLCSICANYWWSKKLIPSESSDERTKKFILYIALSANLILLAFFKYADFFISNANVAFAVLKQPQINALHIILPIGISFYTFTQIAFLIDCWQGKVKERNFLHYLLFVTYFPHLIAGPVLHHSQMMPQFAKAEIYRPNYDKITLAIAIFTIGLVKKLLIADILGEYADVLFHSVENGETPTFLMSWFGVLAYTFQIYFDFSGYSDMAIGLSLFFGIHLPINFNSPYKATSIIDFWRRWHISLSTFLRDYLYVPLGGNRYGKFRRYLNLLITMLLGGLWHGANWTFVLWGAAHSVFLIINHVWVSVVGGTRKHGVVMKVIYWFITFVSVCFAWVLFRADKIGTALNVYKGMLGLNGIAVPTQLPHFLPEWVYIGPFTAAPSGTTSLLITMFIAMVITLLLPNTTNLIDSNNQKIITRKFVSPQLAPVYALAFFLCILRLNKDSPFLYFQF